jgi:hypothetical protein
MVRVGVNDHLATIPGQALTDGDADIAAAAGYQGAL